MRESRSHRIAWIAFVVVAAVVALFGIGDVIRGMDADPAIAEGVTGIAWDELQEEDPAPARLIDLQVRSQGMTLLMLGLLSLSVAIWAFRKRARWAWYAMWIWPAWSAAVFVVMITADRSPDFGPPPPMLSAPVFFFVTVAALAISYRSFFNRSGN